MWPGFRCAVGFVSNAMPCYSPLHGYRARTLTKNGKRGIVFNQTEGFRDLPVEIPCGQCIGCRLERSRQWAMRLMHEAQFHNQSCFITLTYDDKNIPENGTLVKSHFQLFLKRLRKRLGGNIRYFHCGEYGETSGRPHYHACLYGCDFASDRKFHTKNAQGDVLYTSDLLQSIWGHGQCLIGELSFESAAYCARYILKKQTGKEGAKHYERVNLDTGEVYNLLPEYVTMSLKPAIGHTWYENYSTDIFPRDECVIRGKRVKPPTYYARKLEKQDPVMYKKIKSRRVRAAKEHSANNTTERLIVRRTVKEAQIKSLSRKI